MVNDDEHMKYEHKNIQNDEHTKPTIIYKTFETNSSFHV